MDSYSISRSLRGFFTCSDHTRAHTHTHPCLQSQFWMRDIKREREGERASESGREGVTVTLQGAAAQHQQDSPQNCHTCTPLPSHSKTENIPPTLHHADL